MENKLDKVKKMDINFMIDKMKSLMKEKRVMSSKWAKKIGLELLEQDLTSEQKVEVLSYLVTISLDAKNNKDVERFGNEILKYDILNNMSQSIKDRLRRENFFKSYIEMKEEGPKYNRTNLYNGSIELEDLKGLAEENSKTLAGNIFIAEACKHFNLEQLGMKCLKSFKTNSSGLTAEEKKAIVEAEEILKIKKSGFFRAKWDKIYEDLHKASKENETKNEGRE